MKLEIEDIEHLIPVIKARVLRDIKQEDRFITYPKGMQEYLGYTYRQVYTLWSKPDFPRSQNPKGVWLSALKEYQG